MSYDTRARDERRALLDELERVVERMFSATNVSPTERRELLATRRRLEDSYLDALPWIAIATCPFTGEIVEKKIDVFGLDGPWWDSFGPDRPVRVDADVARQPSRHVVSLGALALGCAEDQLRPSPLVNRIEPGPGRPYLVRRYLDELAMRYELRPVEIENDRGAPHTAYVISYFAESLPHDAKIAPEWPRSQSEPRGGAETRWTAADESWSFDEFPGFDGTRDPQRIENLPPIESSC